MVVNFRARGISRGARKLTQTPTLIKKINIERVHAYISRKKKVLLVTTELILKKETDTKKKEIIKLMSYQK